MIRIPLDVIQAVLSRALIKMGFTEERASRWASIFAENSAAGVSSHGLNRFPQFVDFVRRGIVDPTVEMIGTARQGGPAAVDRTMDAKVVDLHAAQRENGDAGVRFPGDEVCRMRQESSEKRVPVDETLWTQVQTGL